MNKLVRQLLPFGSLILIICILSALRPESFLTIDNFLNVFRRSSVYGIIAIGIATNNLTWGKSATIHELTHLVIHQMTHNPYSGLPT